jgi:hypothetical protein
MAEIIENSVTSQKSGGWGRTPISPPIIEKIRLLRYQKSGKIRVTVKKP